MNNIPSKLIALNKALKELSLAPGFVNARKAIDEVIFLLGCPDENDWKLFTDSNGKVRSNAAWFMMADGFADKRAVYKISEENNHHIDFKAYWVKNLSKSVISWIVALTPNFEDEPFYPSKNIGIDFIIPEKADRIIIALSNNYIIRTLELHEGLSLTQAEIFAKWIQPLDFENKKQTHGILWQSFDLEAVNKTFYKGISGFFVELRQYLSDKKIFDERHAAFFTNRLIGRIVFCWFLDKKGIINPEMEYFETGSLKSADYYHSKLERLFFSVLNTPVEDRSTLNASGQKRLMPEMESKNLFNVNIDLKTPFLNGGLFEPREHDKPDNTDLSFPADYFDRLYAFLRHYNFTTDESTSSFQQVAIDPEMLGRIFENLLAEQIEETGQQARKAKGAFYTPREIVDYMCRESLREYLKTKILEVDSRDQRIDLLLDKKPHEWRDQQRNYRDDLKPYKNDIISALDELKVIDPACGSGAFPMGMMQLLLQCYERLEPRFQSYATKLDIIKNNIFGVDIEPMAVEISRLRAWLSIIVDEDSDSTKIEPLPNLDFKFVCANSLIPLKRGEEGLFDTINEKDLIEIRDKYFNARSKNSKENLRAKYEKLIGKGSAGNMFSSEYQKQLESYHPFDSENVTQFFDADFMFGIEGFDVVIGNPPYVNIRKLDNKVKDVYKNTYCSAVGQYDLYVLFIEKALSLLSSNGLISYITSNKFLIAGYGKEIRKIIAERSTLINFVDHSRDKVFEAASVYPVVFLLKKRSQILIEKQDDYNLLAIFGFENPNSILDKLDNIETKLGNLCIIKEAIHTGNIREKIIVNNTINGNCFPLLRGKDCGRYFIAWNGLYANYDINIDKRSGEYAHLIDEKYFIKPKIFLREIALSPTAVYDDDGYFCLNKAYILLPKNDKVDLQYIVAILNSRLMAFYFEKKFGDIRVGGGYLQFKKQFSSKMPILYFESNDICEKISSISTKIHEIKKGNIKCDTKELEAQIDNLVYQLYDLTEEEVAIIENNNG